MKYAFLLFFSFFTSQILAQTEPLRPANCKETGGSQNNSLKLTGSTSFTFSTASDFEVSKSQTLTVTVNASHAYKLYVAGEITSTTTPGNPFPLNAFTIEASNNGGLAKVPLSNQYQIIAQSGITGKDVIHTLTITRLSIDIGQTPLGTHTLTLHFRYCN